MTNDAKEITAALGGRWYRRYGVACCPAHGDQTPSLSLSNAPDGRLLARCHAGCTFAAIIVALRARGLTEGKGDDLRADLETIARRLAEAEAEDQRKAMLAAAIWSETRPIAGSHAEAYLRARGITCALPLSLRHHADLWHAGARLRLPALVAAVEGCDAAAIHRTYLDRIEATKARVAPAKAMLGRVRGGAVRLSQTAGPLVVCEGIETGLSLLSGLMDGPASVWAALSASGLAALHLPDVPGRLIIAADSDDKGAGPQAADDLATRAYRKGWRVTIWPAPAGKDWNDVLQERGRAA